MPTRIIKCEPWCEEHNADNSEEESCVTLSENFGPIPEGAPEIKAGSMYALQWETDNGPDISLEFFPHSAVIDFHALRCIHEAMIQCPDEFRDAVASMVKKLSGVPA